MQVVRRGWAVLLVGVCLTAASCAPPRTALPPTTPLHLTTPSTEPSPSPSPTSPLAVSSLPFHSGEVGLAYGSVTLGATGGVAPYSWSLASGLLPPGLSL